MLVMADVDRLITTNTRMGLATEWKSAITAASDPSHTHVSQDVKSTHVQIVVVSNFWIQPSVTERAITACDLSNSAARIASQVRLDPAYPTPHWLAFDPVAPRIVVTSDDAPWVLMVDVDPKTGALTIDEAFRDQGRTSAGVIFDRAEWPHGGRGRAQPHGAVFGRRE
jgi:hypothetical protein